jgi:DNA-binding IclR family transcriptional regulator
MDSAEAKALYHRLRARILMAIVAHPATAVEVAAQLRQPLSKVVYHTSVLCDLGYVQPDPEGNPRSPNPVFESTRF